jgi:quinol-cytochrome oxidoreductase complex cytochrome b subunit
LFRGFSYSPISRLLFWSFVSCFLLLTWLGSCPAESPYTEVALRLTGLYFILLSTIVVSAHVSSWLYLK